MRSLLLALTLTAACATWTPARAIPSILPLTIGTGTCTAWTVAPALWVTAAHCAVADPPWTLGRAFLSVPLVIDEASDMALISGPLAPALPLAESTPPFGAPISALGFGVGMSDLLLFTGTFLSPDSPFFAASPHAVLVSGANGMPGMSGGPMLWRGRVFSQIIGGGDPRGAGQLLGTGVNVVTFRNFLAEQLR